MNLTVSCELAALCDCVCASCERRTLLCTDLPFNRRLPVWAELNTLQELRDNSEAKTSAKLSLLDISPIETEDPFESDRAHEVEDDLLG